MLMLFALIIMGDRNNGSILIAYIGLSLFVAANLTGVFFGGVCAVADGEIEAARTIGMSKMQTFFHIMLPQIIESIVPVYMSMFVMCMQITSVASVIGVKEFLSATDGISNAVLGIVLSIVGYFLIGTLGDFVITRMGKRKHIKSKDYLEKSEVR
jgi:polar amino acid transport system permease protein